MDQTENGLDRAKNRLNGRANNSVFGPKLPLFWSKKVAQLGVPFPPWQKPLALTEKICQIVFEGHNQDHMHSALNKELSAQCSSRRIKQSASQT